MVASSRAAIVFGRSRRNDGWMVVEDCYVLEWLLLLLSVCVLDGWLAAVVVDDEGNGGGKQGKWWKKEGDGY